MTQEEVGKTTAFLLSDYHAITGEVVRVDGGCHIMGSPGRALEKWEVDSPTFKNKKDPFCRIFLLHPSNASMSDLFISFGRSYSKT